MSENPKITPEQIEAGVAKNVNEYQARVEALRALHKDGAYNPPIDPAALSKAAVEATRGAASLPAMTLHGNNEGSVRLAARDPDADALAKGARHGRKQDSKEGVEGDAGVHAGQAEVEQQARPASPFAQAGHSNSAVGGPAVWVEQTYEAESEEEVRALVPAGAKAVETRVVWQATALVRQA